MMKFGLVLAGFSVSSGLSAGVLVSANLLIWAVLTAWIGSAAAFIGFGLIAYALQPKKVKKAEAEDVACDVNEGLAQAA